MFVMQSLDTTMRCPRKAESRLPDLFDWVRQNELRARTVVQPITRRANSSPTLAPVAAGLAGLLIEVRNDQ
jgi:hypothetical protein